MLEPPNKGNRNSKRFKSLVKAKVPPKRNDLQVNEHVDTHYCRSLVYRYLELANKFPEEAITASFDNKDKFHVGTLMITRHQQTYRIPEPRSRLPHLSKLCPR